jgi:hypothetical protein
VGSSVNPLIFLTDCSSAVTVESSSVVFINISAMSVSHLCSLSSVPCPLSYISIHCLPSSVPCLTSLFLVPCPLSPVSHLCSLSPVLCPLSHISVPCRPSYVPVLHLCSFSPVLCPLSHVSVPCPLSSTSQPNVGMSCNAYGHGLINYKDTKTKCRLYWRLNRVYRQEIHSVMLVFFDPAL